MREPPLPEGFVERTGTRGWLAAHAGLLPSLAASGLDADRGLDALLAGATPSAAGRGGIGCVALPHDAGLVLVRRYRHGGWLGGLRGDRFLDPRRVRRELHVTEALRAAGAPVPRVAFGWAARAGRVGYRLAIGTLVEPDTRDLLAWLRDRPGPAARRAAAVALARAVRTLHDAGARHPDLHAGNLLLRECAGRFEALAVDFDRARLAALGPRDRMRQLGRLERSLWKHGVADAIGPRERAVFLAAYCAGDPALRRRLRAERPRARRSLALHRLGYRLRGRAAR